MATSAQPPADSTQQPQTNQTPMETDNQAPNPPPPPPPPPPSSSSSNNNNHNNHAETTPEQPPQPLPQAVTPGPRAARLQELYAQSLRRTLAKLKWENFAACYPTVASRAEPVLRQVQAQMVEKLGDKCELAFEVLENEEERWRKKEFESVLAARQVVPKLNELEALISEATHRRITAPPDAPKPTPPHLLPAREILSAHLAPSLASHQSLLNARLQTAQSHNAILYDQIRAQRAEIERLLELLEGTVGDVRSANEALEPVVKVLAREAREADIAFSDE
ncbi:hypothetical protein CCMA1212_008834 [Trichoderma ghanense]|uniref:MIND kinetochore complex component Nnf1 n=1 Tax=Trichoderma ghanense TaxID=65468 RepID=A0ABY2GU67_9HYPO